MKCKIKNYVREQHTYFTSLNESFLKFTRLLSVFVGSLSIGCLYGNLGMKIQKKEKNYCLNKIKKIIYQNFQMDTG